MESMGKVTDLDEIRRGRAEQAAIEAEMIARFDAENGGSQSGGGGDGDAGRKGGPGSGGLDPGFILACLRTNSLGDAELFKAIHHGRFVFCKNMDVWLIWTGHHWKIDNMGAALAGVEDVAATYEAEAGRIRREAAGIDDRDRYKQMMSTVRDLEKRAVQLRGDNRRTACLKFAHTSERPLAIEGDALDANPWLLACANGVVELRTGRFRPGRPDDWLCRASPVAWEGLDTPCPRWDKALMEIHDDDDMVVGFMQTLYGMAIIGKVIEKVFPVLTGPGGDNGKTTEIEAIAHVLGPLAGPISSDMLVAGVRQSSSGPTPEIMALKGLRLAYASETEAGAKLSTAKIKWITGKDKLTGRWPNDKFPITFAPAHTLFMMSNFKPKADSEDKALWSRVINVPYDIRFVRDRAPKADNEKQADPGLDVALHKESPGILAWLVRGCLRYIRQGRLIKPPRVVKESEEYRTDQDNFGAFIEYCCLTGPIEEHTCGASELYDVFYQWWVRYVGKYPPKQRTFGSYLKPRFESRKEGGLFRYYGISINWDAANEFYKEPKK